VQQLSQVYRYMLQSNERALITLREELDFIHAYFFLLKTRHGAQLKEEISIPESLLNLAIPPLTLQILVENAVKHNIISATKPLTVKIYAKDNQSLGVSNDLQKKTNLLPSSKVGLENIKRRYEMLGWQTITAGESGGMFLVHVPLIEPNVLKPVNGKETFR
jgi:two-component system LytT family sensor kinase